MPRAGSHYNFGTSRGPDKIGSRAGQNRVAGRTWPAGRVLHVVDLRGLCSQSLALTRQRRRFSSVSSQNRLNMAPISRNSLWFIFHLIASLPCRPTPCRRRGRMRTGSKIPALLKRQAARRRAMRYRQVRELAVLSISLTSLLTTLPRYRLYTI